MKRKITIILACAVVIILVAASGFMAAMGAGGISCGSESCGGKAERDFTVYTDGGKKVTLSDKYGKPVVIVFWASWCSYCVQEMTYLQKVYKQYDDKVEFMAINVDDTKTEAKKIISNYGFTFPVYYDKGDSAYDAYVGGGGIPVTAYINANGSINAIKRGMQTQDSLVSSIKKLI